MKEFKATIGSLVEDAIYTWIVKAENEEEAFEKAYKHWEKENYVDHGTMDIEATDEKKATRIVTNILPMIIENQNINITEMCKESGITRNAYYKIIQGSIPRVDTAIRILRYINQKTGSKFEIENLWQV